MRRVQEIQEEIRKSIMRYQAKTAGSSLPLDIRAEEIAEEIQKQRVRLEAEKAEQRRAESKIIQSEQDLEVANTIIGECKQERKKTRAQIQELIIQRNSLQKFSPEYRQIEQQIQEGKERSWQLEQRQLKFNTAAVLARGQIRVSKTKIRVCTRKITETEGRIRELTDELEALRSKSYCAL